MQGVRARNGMYHQEIHPIWNALSFFLHFICEIGTPVKMHKKLLDILSFTQEIDDVLVRKIFIHELGIHLIQYPVNANALLPCL